MITLDKCCKNIGKQSILKEITWNIKGGEIHGLVGENGAGKTALIKMISGVYPPTSGNILINGNKVKFASTEDALRYGIATVYQESNVVEKLTVAENIFLGRTADSGKRFISWKRIHSRSREILDRLNCSLDTRMKVSQLNAGQKQLIEIARVLSYDARLIILDEPYINLSYNEIEELFKIVKILKKLSIAIIYISHKVDDIQKLCDRVSVLNHGRMVLTLERSQFTKNLLIKKMSNSEKKFHYPKIVSKPGRVVIEAKSLKTGRGVNDICFNLYKGEILGIAGLLGSGRTGLARALYGIDRMQSGTILMNGLELKNMNPQTALKKKIGYLPEEREKGGLIHSFSIPMNITSSNLSTIRNRMKLDTGREKDIARNYIKKLNIQTRKTESPIAELSGGNQQKVAIAKLLFADCRILILDEPTREIDSSTKVEVYNLMEKCISEGISIILISSNIEELMGMSDRILVLCDGRVVRTLERHEFSEEEILLAAMGTQHQYPLSPS